MNDEELEIELNKVYEEGDILYVPEKLIGELINLLLLDQIKKIIQ